MLIFATLDIDTQKQQAADRRQRTVVSASRRCEQSRRQVSGVSCQKSVGVEREREMVANERRLLRKKLDREMRFYRLAAREKDPTNGLLRAVRQALKIPLKEMAGMMGIGESNVFELEEREETGSIMLRSLERMAEEIGRASCRERV